MVVKTEIGEHIRKINSRSPEKIRKILESAQPIITGDHFVLKNGGHSSTFFQFSRIVRNPDNVTVIAGDMVDTFDLDSKEVTRILVPTTAGVFLGWELSKKLGVPITFAEVDEMTYPVRLRAGHVIVPSDRILVVNDIMTTGRGNEKLAEIVLRDHATVVGIANFASRAQKPMEQLIRDLPPENIFISVELQNMDDYGRDDCPMCKAQKPEKLFIDYN